MSRSDKSVLERVEVPLVVAPMAGGPTTVELVAAAAQAGAVSALAWGNTAGEKARDELVRLNDAGCGLYGINLFYPQRPLNEEELAAAQEIAVEEGVDMGLDLGAVDYSFGWNDKFELALELDAAMVWSMFGCFSDEEMSRVHAAGKEAWVTVTTEDEARVAHERGADVLCVQGPEAGGHRGTWDFSAEPDWRPLADLAAAVHAAVPNAVLVAAGGLRTADDVQQALEWPGVRAVSCGSGLVLCGEAGTSDANRELIAAGGTTVSTRALSGRYARGLETNYTKTHPDMAPIYPLLAPILAPRRAAGEPEVSYCLVGIRPDAINGGSAAEVVERLSGSGQ